MQFRKGRDRCTRNAKGHASAGGRVKHPGSHDEDNARVDLNVDTLARCALFTVLTPHTTTVKRVPAVMNLNLLPDMGRMTL